MNETIRTILTRRSIRSYENKPVPRESLELILECGQFAATARGLQPWHFTAITNRAMMDKISNACRDILAPGDTDFDVFRGAPCVIIASYEEANPRYGDIDCANAVENMALAAKALGLGSCYIAMFRPAFDQDPSGDMKRAFGIPEGYRPTLSLAIGYTKNEPTERAPRRENTINWVE